MILPTRADIVELAKNGTLLDAVFTAGNVCTSTLSP